MQTLREWRFTVLCLQHDARCRPDKKNNLLWDTLELHYVILVSHTCREATQGLLHSCHGNKSPSLTLSQCFEIYFGICFGPICGSVDTVDWTEETYIMTAFMQLQNFLFNQSPLQISQFSVKEYDYNKVVIRWTFHLSKSFHPDSWCDKTLHLPLKSAIYTTDRKYCVTLQALTSVSGRGESVERCLPSVFFSTNKKEKELTDSI